MKKIWNPKKPFLWILIGVVIAAVVTAFCLLLIPPQFDVSAPLDECIVSTLRLVHRSSHTEGKYPAVAYTVLGTKEQGDSVTVYGVMMYREYTCTVQNDVKIWGSAHSPFSITAEEKEDGTYEATACWWPEDGKNFASSIRKKFPLYCEQDAINAQQYYDSHDTACKAAVDTYVTAADKYIVLESERDNVWLAYSPGTTGAYIQLSSGYIADGNYAAEDGMVVFTFGSRKAAFAVDGDEYIFNAEKSENIPAEWSSVADELFLSDGTRFSDQARGDTVPVGETLTVSGGMTWMSEDAIQKMFGYVPDNSHTTDSTSDKPYYLPIKVLTTRNQLDQFLTAHKQDEQWSDLNEADFSRFDEAFFKENALVMTYYKAGTYMAEPSVAAYAITEEDSCLSVRLNVRIPNPHDTTLGQWLLFSGIKKSDMEGIKVLEAYVETTVTEEDPVYSGNNLSFTGTVTQVEGDSMLMECTDVPQFSSGVWVFFGNVELAPKVGETYTVTYEDIVMPSLPPRITAVTITKP